MYALKKMPKERPFKECHLKRMAHIGYVVVTKKFSDETFMVIECNMNGHWYGAGFGEHGSCQWWPSAWYSVTTKDEVANGVMGYSYEFFDTFDEFREKYKTFVKERVFTKAPNDFSGGKYAFREDFPLWIEQLRHGWSYKEVQDLYADCRLIKEIEEYINQVDD
jgi:hypothetical protein